MPTPAISLSRTVKKNENPAESGVCWYTGSGTSDGITAEPEVGTEIVTTTEADEPLNPAPPPYDARMLFAPVASWLPNTFSDAVADPPEPERFAVPKVTEPTVKVTDPVGLVVPALAFTVAVRVVEEAIESAAGFAAKVVVVPFTGWPFH